MEKKRTAQRVAIANIEAATTKLMVSMLKTSGDNCRVKVRNYMRRLLQAKALLSGLTEIRDLHTIQLNLCSTPKRQLILSHCQVFAKPF